MDDRWHVGRCRTARFTERFTPAPDHTTFIDGRPPRYLGPADRVTCTSRRPEQSDSCALGTVLPGRAALTIDERRGWPTRPATGVPRVPGEQLITGTSSLHQCGFLPAFSQRLTRQPPKSWDHAGRPTALVLWIDVPRTGTSTVRRLARAGEHAAGHVADINAPPTSWRGTAVGGRLRARAAGS